MCVRVSDCLTCVYVRVFPYYVYLSVWLSVSRCVCLSVCLPAWLCVFLPVYLSDWLSVCLTVCVSVCLSVWLSVQGNMLCVHLIFCLTLSLFPSISLLAPPLLRLHLHSSAFRFLLSSSATSSFSLLSHRSLYYHSYISIYSFSTSYTPSSTYHSLLQQWAHSQWGQETFSPSISLKYSQYHWSLSLPLPLSQLLKIELKKMLLPLLPLLPFGNWMMI